MCPLGRYLEWLGFYDHKGHPWILFLFFSWYWSLPSEEFELIANSLSFHIETQRKLILRTLNYLRVSSQDDSHCELSVSFPWVCNSHGELALSYLWYHTMSSPWDGSSELTMQTHRKFTASSKCEPILWVHCECELTECPHNEPTAR